MQKLAIITYVALVLTIPAEAILSQARSTAAPGSASSEIVTLLPDAPEVLAQDF